MAAAATIDWTIGHVLLIEVIGLAGLITLLRVRRAWRTARKKARAGQSIGTAPSVQLFKSYPFPPAPDPPHGVTSLLAAGRPILAADAHGSTSAAPFAEVQASPATVAPAPPLARKRPRPLREVEETVLSAQSLLGRAEEFLAAGNADEAATQLRLCIRLSSKLKDARTEARARLELGDLARASGDLTTACEHWQLARALFADVRQPTESTAAELRMERAGCPTDWVLNQF
jgi:hypothetical protein